jgi:hypothetical protein
MTKEAGMIHLTRALSLSREEHIPRTTSRPPSSHYSTGIFSSPLVAVRDLTRYSPDRRAINEGGGFDEKNLPWRAERLPAPFVIPFYRPSVRAMNDHRRFGGDETRKFLGHGGGGARRAEYILLVIFFSNDETDVVRALFHRMLDGS